MGANFGRVPYGKIVIKDNGVRKFTDDDYQKKVLDFVYLARKSDSTLEGLNDALGQICTETNFVNIELDDDSDTLIEGLAWKNIINLLNEYKVTPRCGKKWTLKDVAALRKNS